MPLNTTARLDDPYVVPEYAAAREASALSAMLHLLSATDVEPDHLRELLSICIWKYTEAGAAPKTSKYRIRYRSAAAVDVGVPTPVQHEHVWPRKQVVDRLLQLRAGRAADTEVRDYVISHAVACTVSQAEHQRLSQVDQSQGWRRYLAADITVLDMTSGRPLDLSDLARFG